MSTGRAREEAPDGYVTLRRASKLLGVPYTTLLHRIKRGRLEAMEETTPGGEPRYYISEETIRRELKRSSKVPEVVTTSHLEEVEISLEAEVENNREIIERAVEQLVGAIGAMADEVQTQRLEVTAHLAGIAATLEAQGEHFRPLIREIITRLERLERIEFSVAEARSNSAGLLELQRELIRLQKEKAESDRAHQQMMAEHMRREEEHRVRVEERLAAMEGQGQESWWRRWFSLSTI